MTKTSKFLGQLNQQGGPIALTWHPMAIPSLLVLVLGSVLAALVVVSRPHARQNQRLAVLLTHGALTTASIAGLRWLPTDAVGARMLFSVFVTLAILIPYVYVGFLATLKTPLVRPFQRPLGKNILAGITILSLAVWTVRPRWFLADVGSIAAGRLGSVWENYPGPLFPLLALMAIAAYVYGLVVAVSAYRRASTPTGRTQTKSYAVAFGVRDSLTAANIVFVALFFQPTNGIAVQRLLNDIGFPIIDAAFFALLAYGILKHQLFDIDYKIRFALSQSTVALVFGAAFFIGKEVVEAVLPIEGVLFGVAAALLVAAAFRPIQRFGWWVAERVMPPSTDGGHRRDQRRQDVYRAALEGAMTDGIITKAERVILERVRAQLGLAEHDAEALELEVAAAPSTTVGRSDP